MLANPASPEPEPTLPPHQAVENDSPSHSHDAEFYVEILDDIMQTARGIARAIGQGILNDPAATKIDRTNAALAVDRIARTIRRCILLVTKLQQARPIRATTARARTEARVRVRAEVQAARTRAPPATPTNAPKAPSPARAERLDTLPPGTVPEIIAVLSNDLAAATAPLRSRLPEGLDREAGQSRGEAAPSTGRRHDGATPRPPKPRHREPLRCEAVFIKPHRSAQGLSPRQLHRLNCIPQPNAPPPPTPAAHRNTLGRMLSPPRPT